MNRSIKKILLYWPYRIRTHRIIDKISPCLDMVSGKKILDIGSGTCLITDGLRKKNFSVSPLDIRDLSLKDKISPLIFDGKKIPFADDSYDVALIITVLHHTKDPEELLAEAKRVARKIIVIEDTYQKPLKKYWDFALDSLVNGEFSGHPHSNRPDAEWQKTFSRLGFSIKKTFSWRSHFGFQHTLYFLEQ